MSEDKMGTGRLLGPTGEFPYGKLNEDDEGGIRIAVGSNRDTESVIMDFGSPTAWIGMRPEHATAIAMSLLQHALHVKRGREDEDRPKPTLVLMVGLPRSGKSYCAKRMKHPIVCPDAIRLALHGQQFVASAEPMVWAVAKLMVASLFEAGHLIVILDACNGTKKRRAEWANESYRRVYLTVPTPLEECATRARAEGRENLLPIIERMAASWEPVSDDELEPIE